VRISNVRTIMIELPGKDWIIRPEIKSFGCVLVFVDTDEGITGETFLWTFGKKRLAVLSKMVESLKDDVLNEDPYNTERIWQKLWFELRFFGVEGISIYGISAIDRACWDIIGKAEGKPLYKLLGGYRDEVPVYGSGLWLQLSIDELRERAKTFVKKGYRAIKMRIGKPRIEEDIERIKAVREVIGQDISLMVDANQRLTIEHAIKLGRKLEKFNITWFEEPLPAYDLEGSARVAAALDIPIANGENIFTRYGFRRMLEIRAADILMPDLIRVGGITEFRKVANLAEAYNLPITPHLFPEESMHLVGSNPICIYVEDINWFSELYVEKINIKNGSIILPNRPGFGFTFNQNIIERFSIQNI